MFADDIEEMKREATYAMIRVNYRNIEGYHVFTSEDVRGLYVASKDPEKAFHSVAVVLHDLIKIKTNRDCQVEPAEAFSEFLYRLDEKSEPRVTRPILRSGEFVIRCAA